MAPTVTCQALAWLRRKHPSPTTKYCSLPYGRERRAQTVAGNHPHARSKWTRDGSAQQVPADVYV